MKALVVYFIVSSFITVSAQPNAKDKFKFGVKIGGANCNVTGSRVKSPAKGGLVFGLWLQLKMSKHWDVSAELLSIKKGAGGFRADRPRKAGEYLLGLSYIEMPLLFRYDYKKFNLEFGPGIGVLISKFEILHDAQYPDMTDTYPFKKKEFSFNVGIGYSFKQKWHLGFRFSHSLLPVRIQLPDISKPVYNRVFTIAVARRLIFKKPKTKETNVEE